jgi:DNA-binding GntR family transcriptional regulator
MTGVKQENVRKRIPWVPKLGGQYGPIYLALAQAIEADIAAGRLRAGQRMPPQRTLADSLGVDLTTVTRAYREAQDRGLIEAVVGRGTFVKAGSPGSLRGDSEPRSLVDMR